MRLRTRAGPQVCTDTPAMHTVIMIFNYTAEVLDSLLIYDNETLNLTKEPCSAKTVQITSGLLYRLCLWATYKHN
jgi:hypothetical protein